MTLIQACFYKHLCNTSVLNSALCRLTWKYIFQDIARNEGSAAPSNDTEHLRSAVSICLNCNGRCIIEGVVTVLPKGLLLSILAKYLPQP